MIRISDDEEKDKFKKQNNTFLKINALWAYDKLIRFDPSAEEWTNNIDKPKAGDIILFYSPDSTESGKEFKKNFFIISSKAF